MYAWYPYTYNIPLGVWGLRVISVHTLGRWVLRRIMNNSIRPNNKMDR